MSLPERSKSRRSLKYWTWICVFGLTVWLPLLAGVWAAGITVCLALGMSNWDATIAGLWAIPMWIAFVGLWLRWEPSQ